MMHSRDIRNPFPGLRPFETDEYRLFFGREGQSDELLARLQRSRFLAVVGTSGSGKSSLIRAGLLPALRGGLMAGAGSGWRIAVMRPGGDPIGNLAWEFAKEDVLMQAGAGLPPAEAEAVIDATLRTGSLGVVDVARQARLAEHEKLLIVVDQFEELFRFRSAVNEKTGTGDEASAFVKLLLAASQQRQVSIYVVLTMRSDFLGDCSQFQGLPEAINDGQYLIPRLTRDERRFAVTGPVGVTRGKITEPLVNRLLNDVGDNPDQLPILQHSLMRTWDFWASHRRNGEPIGLEHYEAVGTMSDALSRHANEAWAELDERGQVVAELLFKALTERGADNREIRRPTSLQDICAITNATEAEVVAVIDVFRGPGRSFLMPPAGVALKPETVIDISHESLIRNWERLRAWVDDEAQSARIYRRLADAATDYYKKAGGLLDDVTLRYVLRWRERLKPEWAWGVRYHPDFNTAMSYLELSSLSADARIEAEQERERRELETTRAFAEKQARAARRLRLLAIGMAVMFMLALATAGYAMVQRKQALESSRIAVEEKLKAVKQSEALAEALKVKEVAENERKLSDARRFAAEREQQKAEAAEDAALARAVSEEKRAKSEAKRANDALARAKQEVINDHNNRDALASFQRGNIAEAENKLANLVQLYQGDALRQAWVLSYLGAAQRRLGKLDQSIKNLKTAQAVQRGALTKDDPEYLDTITWLAHAHGDKGDYELAQPLYAEALETRRGVSINADIAVSLENLARNYNNIGKAEEAAKIYDEALTYRRRNPRSPDLIAALNEVARFYLEQGEPLTAVRFYEETLSNQETYLEPYDPNIADTFSSLAEVYEETAFKGRAKAYNDLARDIRRSGLTRREPNPDNFAFLAESYAAVGKYRQAGRLLIRAQEIEDQKNGRQAPSLAHNLIRRADFFRNWMQSEPETADTERFYAIGVLAYRRALEISTKSSQLKYRLEALDGLGSIYLAHKNFTEAEEFYKLAVEIRDQTHVATDIQLDSVQDAYKAELAVSLYGLGRAAAGLEKYTEAEAHFIRTQEVIAGLQGFLRKFVDGKKPYALFLQHASRARLAEIYAKQGRVNEADEQYRLLAETLKGAIGDVLKDGNIAHSYLDIVEKAGRFYFERGDTAAAESFYLLVWPREIRPTVTTLVFWPEAYSKSLMELAPLSSVGNIIRILESYSALFTKTGRTHDETLISHGIARMQERLMMEGLGSESP
jgi:tetratricopeptide (TPR) repeat protein